MGVNKLLEKKVQIEKSEKMTLASEVGNFGRILGESSRISEKASIRLAGLATGKMSTYIRQQQDTVNFRQSLKGNTNHFKSRNDLDQSVGSIQALWMKNRVRNIDDNQSSFKDANQSFNSSCFSRGSYSKQLSTNLSGSSRNQNNLFKSSFVSSFSRNRRNRQSGEYKKVRVQVISDFDS